MTSLGDYSSLKKIFKNISVKKAKKITAIICVLIGIIICVVKLCSINNLFSLDAFLGVIMGIGFSTFLYFAINFTVFDDMKRLENNISYLQSFLSKEEYRKINLKLGDNRYAKLSVEESKISYYAKIKSNSDTDVIISIRKDEKEISMAVMDVIYFRRFFY